MLHRSLLLGLLLLVGLALVAHCATPPPSAPSTPEMKGKQAASATKNEKTDSEWMTKPPAPATAQQMGMPQGYQPDEDWTYFVDKPQSHFLMAREDAARMDMKTAAYQLRQGAAFMRLEAMRADTESRKAIEESSNDVDMLADRLQQGVTGTEEQMDQIIAHANEVLAQNHYRKATSAWGKNNVREAGLELQAANIDLANGMNWIGKSWTQATSATRVTAHEVAAEMASNAKVAQEDAMRAMDDTGKGIEALGKDLQAYGKHAQTPSQETEPKPDSVPPEGE